MRLYWGRSFIKILSKKIFFCSVFLLSSCVAASALTIGPMQTKRERAQHLSRPSISFEQIVEAYLKEDFASVGRLSGPYLSTFGAPRADEVRELRSRALAKLDRPNALENVQSPSNVSLLRSTPAFGTGSGNESTSSLRQLTMEEGPLYGVQVGSFSKQQNAERLLNRLLRNRYDAYINKDTPNRFRVRVGRVASREEARTLEQSLQKDGYPTKIFP
jgi:hypothetical protein